VFAAKYQLKRVTVAIGNCASLHSLCCLINRKGKTEKRVCIGKIKFSAVSTVTTRVRMPSISTDTASQPFCHSFIVLSMMGPTLFEVSREICCSGVSSRYCCYRNHAAGSMPILKLFIIVNGKLNKVSLCQKYLVNVVNWRSCVILIVAVRYFFRHSVVFDAILPGYTGSFHFWLSLSPRPKSETKA